tara:strand:+ start:220 stop:468 length:249 start_codon:yes stop_codon:yes gene_type:complete
MVDVYSLTPNEQKLFDLLTSQDFVSDEDVLVHVSGFSLSLATSAKKETRGHTMAVRRLEKKLPPTFQIERIRGRGFRLIITD